jgi:hypothetical protein
MDFGEAIGIIGGVGRSALPLCVPKIRFCNSGDEGRQGQAAR